MEPGHDHGHPVSGGGRGFPCAHAFRSAAEQCTTLEAAHPAHSPEPAALSGHRTGFSACHANLSRLSEPAGRKPFESRYAAGYFYRDHSRKGTPAAPDCIAPAVPVCGGNHPLSGCRLGYHQGSDQQPFLAVFRHPAPAPLVPRNLTAGSGAQGDRFLRSCQPGDPVPARCTTFCHGVSLHHEPGADAAGHRGFQPERTAGKATGSACTESTHGGGNDLYRPAVCRQLHRLRQAQGLYSRCRKMGQRKPAGSGTGAHRLSCRAGGLLQQQGQRQTL